jgi:hypothetical protein
MVDETDGRKNLQQGMPSSEELRIYLSQDPISRSSLAFKNRIEIKLVRAWMDHTVIAPF